MAVSLGCLLPGGLRQKRRCIGGHGEGNTVMLVGRKSRESRFEMVFKDSYSIGHTTQLVLQVGRLKVSAENVGYRNPWVNEVGGQ